MRWLLFLSRLAFICGVCFVISLGFAMMKRDNNEPFSQTIIMIGFVLGVVVVPITVLCYLGVSIAGKKLSASIPRWLIWLNVLFLFVLLFYIFFVNDHYYNQK
jgi:hypothetical protein